MGLGDGQLTAQGYFPASDSPGRKMILCHANLLLSSGAKDREDGGKNADIVARYLEWSIVFLWIVDVIKTDLRPEILEFFEFIKHRLC